MAMAALQALASVETQFSTRALAKGFPSPHFMSHHMIFFVIKGPLHMPAIIHASRACGC